MLLSLHASIFHAIVAPLHLDDLLTITHTEHLKGIGRQGQNFLRTLALKVFLSNPLLKQLVFPLQLAILRKNSHAYIQLAHSEMIGAFDIADNIIQIAAKENLFIDGIASGKIIHYAHHQQSRDNHLGLKIANQNG